jgi:hypothetical protein
MATALKEEQTTNIKETHLNPSKNDPLINLQKATKDVQGRWRLHIQSISSSSTGFSLRKHPHYHSSPNMASGPMSVPTIMGSKVQICTLMFSSIFLYHDLFLGRNCLILVLYWNNAHQSCSIYFELSKELKNE